jgi:hypothetical protein
MSGTPGIVQQHPHPSNHLTAPAPIPIPPLPPSTPAPRDSTGNPHTSRTAPPRAPPGSPRAPPSAARTWDKAAGQRPLHPSRQRARPPSPPPAPLPGRATQVDPLLRLRALAHFGPRPRVRKNPSTPFKCATELAFYVSSIVSGLACTL